MIEESPQEASPACGPCPGCTDCLSQQQIRERVERPREVEFWGHASTVTPALVPQIFGDGLAWLKFVPLNTRPAYYLVRIGSDVDDESIYDLLDDIQGAIAEQWGDTQNYECSCVPEVKYCPECRPEWPALSSDSGCSWNWVDSPRFISTMRCGRPTVSPACPVNP